MKQIIKKSIGIISRRYHQVRSLRPVWKLINIVSIVKFSQPVLNEEQNKILQDLRNDGIAITHIDKILPPEIFKQLQQFAMDRWSDADVKERYEKRHEAKDGEKLMNKSFFLVDLWKGKRILDLNNIFTQFSLKNEILDIIQSYMGMLVKFTDWRLQVTVPMPEGMRSYASQDWHRDPEDQQLIKMFLYLNDVDESAGPFIYLKKSHISGKWRHLFPQQPPRGSNGIDSEIPTDDRVVCTGKAGTVIFCDTSGLHRGGHAKSNNRFMYTSIFMSTASVWSSIYTNQNKKDIFAVQNKIKKEPKYYSW